MRKQILSLLALLLLAACGSESLDVDTDQVFSKQFPLDKMSLTGDKGQTVTLKAARAMSGTSGAHGFLGGGYDPSNQFPFPYFLNFSNYVHAWNPSASRTVELQFQGWGDGSTGCLNLQINSNRGLHVLRYGSPSNPWSGYGGGGTVSVAGSNGQMLTVTGQNLENAIVVFSLNDLQNTSCPAPTPWWNWGFDPYNPFGGNGGYCGAQSSTSGATLQITGSAGACGSPTQVNLDLNSQVNNLNSGGWGGFGGNYNPPYISQELGSSYQLTGRVLEYSGPMFWNF